MSDLQRDWLDFTDRNACLDYIESNEHAARSALDRLVMVPSQRVVWLTAIKLLAYIARAVTVKS